MKPRTLVILALIAVFAAALAWALLREVSREEAILARAISGVVEVDARLAASGAADIVRTDRLVLMLVDPATREPVALRFVTPLVPPQTIQIGADDARGGVPLSGAYLVVGITDKDGEIYKVSPGEIYGRSPEPVPLGREEYHLWLNEPFRGSLFNEARSGPAAGAGSASGGAAHGPAGPPGDEDPRFGVAGTIVVGAALRSRVEPTDRLVILLFDPEQARPVAFKIIPHALLPQRFSIALPPELRAGAKVAYQLRVVTDKNESPFESAEGEVIGRSAQPIALGTQDLVFELDQPYVR